MADSFLIEANRRYGKPKCVKGEEGREVFIHQCSQQFVHEGHRRTN